ncbi:hypothetical protein [Spirosoma sp.]|uniref:hypothetical protein n=1 Tax=Spirosoma sp. TaxID=1899569 RepID=UPI003B3AF632
MKRFFLSAIIVMVGYVTASAQCWQGQIGTNLATLPGRSIELATAWSPDLNRWALTINAGYTYRNHFSAAPSGYMCDCGLDKVNTSGAFLKVGYRTDVLRSIRPQAKIGIPIGLILIGSQYQQEGVIQSFPDGNSRYITESARGFVIGAGLTAAMNIRFSERWNLDLGLQKFVGFKRRTDYLLLRDYMTHQPGVGLTNWKSFWPGMQGIVTVNYRLRGL